jgi:cell division protein FtsA
MGKEQAQLITAIDLGSAKTCVLVAEVNDGTVRYRGHGVAESRGSRKGIIADLDKTVASVQKAVEAAEASASCSVEHGIVGIAGPHVRGVNSRGGITLGSRPREIARDDIRTAVDRARGISLPADREIVHLLPREFILDGHGAVRDPAGMMGTKLEVQMHLVTAAATATQNVVTAVNRAGVHVDDTIYEPLAVADATLRPDERELGVCLLDIGAGSTDLIVYHEGVVVHTGAVPVGGDHFTNDVAVGLRTPLAEAEKIKTGFGHAVVTRVPEGNEIEVPAVGDRPPRLLPQRFLVEILEPRARELFEMTRDHLRQAGMLDLIAAGTVLTGGGSRLRGMSEISEDVLRRPSRLGSSAPLSKMPAALIAPEFAAVIGMVFYAHRTRMARVPQEQGITAKLRALFARNTA